MTSTIPTPAEFMLLPTDPDEDQEHDERTPLERLADLEARVAALEGGPETAESWWAEERAQVDTDRDHELADLSAKYDVMLRLIEEIGGIVKKSTSKVSLEVKAAIDAWANPNVPESQQVEGTVEEGGSMDGEMVGGLEYAPDAQPIPPQNDAPVEEWREYARALGVDDQTQTVLDQMNRSQIRTMLGIEQPVGA